jgi:hypothetical protein
MRSSLFATITEKRQWETSKIRMREVTQQERRNERANKLLKRVSLSQKHYSKKRRSYRWSMWTNLKM